MLKLGKKGVFGLEALSPAVISIVVVAIVSVLGLTLLADQQADLTASSAEYNATSDAIEGVSKFPSKLPMIAGVIVLVLIIAILVRAFRGN